MAYIVEGTTEIVEAVKFSFFTDEEVRNYSFKKITNPLMLDSVERPVPGGLYDPALGSIDENTPCQSCGQRSFHCPGHCGHIDLVSTAYNPLLFNLLHNLLQKTCFYCHHFRSSRSEVQKYVSQLELIRKGDVVGAKNLDSISLSESLYHEDSDGSHVSCSSSVNSSAHNNCSENLKQHQWTSLQCTEALSVLDDFLKLRYKSCNNCKAKNPQVTKPTFGWFHMAGLSDAQARANVIRGSKLERPLSSVVEEKSSSEVENVNDMFPLEDGIGADETNSSIAPADGIQDTVNKKLERSGAQAPIEFLKQKSFFSGPLLPSEVKDTIERLWENEAELCSFISAIQQERICALGSKAGCSMFFLETILVPPIKFRPPSKGQSSVMEHPQTVLLGKVLQANIALGNAHANNLGRSTIINRWMDLQLSINVMFDAKTAAGQGQRDTGSGICQLLEKKEGVFRQKMMGKRVNYACRSVISPDPYLAVNEIGIPPYFAVRLTYPEKVTPWNVVKLRDAIVNGPEIHPGATHYVDKLSTVKLGMNKKMRVSMSRKLPSSRGVVAQPGKSSDYEFEGKIVYRHLQDGDIVLVNRQPTLHKPSIMAHVVRVLKGEKTLRMHYANCSTYNADFDGDEMNVHFPQDEISRAEAYNIVNANNQYIVPSRGDPIRGLIQDHIVSAVLLTKKDTFLTREQYNQLLYSSGLSCGSGAFSGKPGKKVSILDSEDEMQPLLPAIWKPEPLWSGKQVITAVLNHITRGRKPFTSEKDGKIPREYFGREIDGSKFGKGKDPGPNLRNHKRIEKKHGEYTLLIHKNELVRGVIDKAQFDKYGLVHMVQELYGSNTAGVLLSALSRVFTTYLQMHGFTCGVDDLLILPNYDMARKIELDKSENIGESVHYKFIGSNHGKIDPVKLQMEVEKIIRSNGEAAITRLDRMMKNELNELTSKVNKDLLLEGLVKPFPKNCLSLMTTTGAKGSTVNFSQISSFLGQQDLEGKRVPRMVSGKTLPCFPPWDCASRAGGFISDRFLTGLRPQEYYFHCMAGREGLVDTAVKTSRSGYLQRCLIKNLECLKVCYDYTVRDADGSIVQFNYGDDGVDVHQTSFITEFEALALNQEVVREKFGQDGKFNYYIQKLPKELRKKTKKFIETFKEQQQDFDNKKQRKDFMNLVTQKYISSLAQPGEPVGVLAAQSVGEPSTQMTLNTFHLAGRGEVNVTLGIPRLQEILMTAANDIKTPIMTCPLQMGRSKDDAERLAAKLKKVTVADVTESMEVSVVPFTVKNYETCSIYKLKMKLYEPALYPPYTGISLEDCQGTLETVFVRELEDAIQNHLLLLSKISGIKHFLPDSRTAASKETDEDASGDGSKGGGGDDDDDDDDDDDAGAEDLGSDAQKRKGQVSDEMDYGDSDDGESDEGEPSTGLVEDIDRTDGDGEISNDEEVEMSNPKDDEDSKVPPKSKSSENKKSKTDAKRKKRRKAIKKDFDRSIYVKAKGRNFEIHFKFTNEPHILLAQIAQKAANKVYIRSSGNIEMCQVIDCNRDQVIFYGEDPKNRKDIPGEEKKKLPALQTAGVDFTAFWKMQDKLDVRYIYSNNVHAMLNTYGVEAARATIIKEVFNVFNAYGVKVNIRHLSLIADFMTHSGGYRPMNRHGGIAESVSPFSKMTFETASKFIVQAASHGLTDTLESASARICLGLPVKMGTGCFDLMQKIEI